MNDFYPPNITVIMKTQTSIGLLIDTRNNNTKNGCINLTALNNLNNLSTFAVSLEGFDFLQPNTAQSFILRGKIFISYQADFGEKKILIAEPQYVIFNKNKCGEQTLVRSLKSKIHSFWSEELNHSLANNINKPLSTDPVVNLKARDRLAAFITKYKLSNKHFFFLLLTLSVIINVLFFQVNYTPINQNQSNINSTELAKSQEVILNNAFKDIGINREKLASDMSCFQE